MNCRVRLKILGYPLALTLLSLISLACAPTPSAFAHLKNQPIVEIPFETSLGVVFFPVKVNSEGPFQFLLDTGGGGSLFERAMADRLSLKQERGEASVSGNSALSVGVIPKASVEVGPVKFESRLITTSFTTLEPIFGRKLEGILGGDFMSRYVVEFDYEQKRMRLYDIATYLPDKTVEALPLSFSDNIPYVNLKVTLPNGKSVAGEFLVDSGGGGMAIHVFQQIVDREKLFENLKTLDETGFGIGGTTDRRTARGEILTIGKYRLSGPTVTISPDAANAKAKPGSVGLVGMEVLGRFRIVFDYSRKSMYLHPGRSLHDRFIYDSTGLRLRASSHPFSPPFVSGVRAGSPAEIAGIKVGDVVDKIDRVSTRSMSLDEVRRKLRMLDQKFSLTVNRQGTPHDVVLQTRELLN
jgi:hypothetical protein